MQCGAGVILRKCRFRHVLLIRLMQVAQTSGWMSIAISGDVLFSLPLEFDISLGAPGPQERVASLIQFPLVSGRICCHPSHVLSLATNSLAPLCRLSPSPFRV